MITYLFAILFDAASSVLTWSIIFGLGIFVGIIILMAAPQSKKNPKDNDKDIYITIDENDHAHISVVPKGIPHDGMKVTRERLEEMTRSGEMKVSQEEWEAAKVDQIDK